MPGDLTYMQTICITITGEVQGVFFRQSTREKANMLEVKGQVRNLPEGGVEIIATGDPKQLEELATWCKQGPLRARVDSVEVRDLPLQVFAEFSVIRSRD